MRRKEIMNSSADLHSLKAMWTTFKKLEDAAKNDRLNIEAAILAHFPTDKTEGSVTDADAGVTVSYKVTRTVDTEAVQTAWDSLTVNAQKAFKWKADLDLKAFRAVQDMDPQSFTQISAFVTTKPAKPSVSVKGE